MMKKILMLFAALALLLTSCAGTRPLDRDKLPPKGDGTDLPSVDLLPADIGGEIIEIDLFDWQSTWAGWTDDERVLQGIVNPDTVSHDYPRTHLPLYRIGSPQELKKFIEDHGDVFSMDYKFDEKEGFAAATAHCDTEFFEEKLLLAAYVEAPSGAFRYGVRNIGIDDGKLTIEIEQTNDPEAYTDDMSGWLVAVEVQKIFTSNCTSFDAVYVGVKGRENEPATAPVMSEPPELTVITPDGSVKASMGTGSWSFPNGDGTSTAKMYDSAHPTSREFISVMPRLSNDKYYDVTGGVDAKLAFDFHRAPKITVKRWEIAEMYGQDNISSMPEQIEVIDGVMFQINQKGNFVYEVTALWDTADDGVSGNVTYVFIIGSTT